MPCILVRYGVKGSHQKCGAQRDAVLRGVGSVSSVSVPSNEYCDFISGFLMFSNIVKRDGRVVRYDADKIIEAVRKAMCAEGHGTQEDAERVSRRVEAELLKEYPDADPTVEQIQDVVEKALMHEGFEDVAKSYILYRASRTRTREMKTHLMRVFDELTLADAIDSDMKRDNANVDGDTAMGMMLKYGSEGAKDYNEKYLLTPQQAKAHREGDIHIHDFDFYALTTTCCQIDLIKLFNGGFSTGHGYLREPNDIRSYCALACIAVQSNQNDQHGGQSIVNFDYGLAPGVVKTYRKCVVSNLLKALELLAPGVRISKDDVKAAVDEISSRVGCGPQLAGSEAYDSAELEWLGTLTDSDTALRVHNFAVSHSREETDSATYQAMEALIHNLNTMHSRAGAQTPFSSVNYGMDTSPEGRMVVRNMLLATERGLGQGEIPIFPIQIFRVKSGVNYNEGDPNFDLFQLACRVSSKRLFPNFSFIDAPFNLQYYKPGHPETEIAYMGCRTRVMGNVHDRTREIAPGRGNLSFTSINLPRLAIEAKGDEDRFFDGLQYLMEMVAQQLDDRFEIQARKRVRNFPFLMGQGVWIDSESLGWNDEIREVIKHGTLSVGFIGLAETLKALYGRHHAESEEAQAKGLEIVGRMRKFLDDRSKEKGMNYTLLATPAEGLSGRFIKMDKERYGIIPGITDKEFYTNSFHVPVNFRISAFDKIRIEAPYHALTNAGHISYVELDGDTAHNPKAFEAIIRAMHDAGVGYGSVNHPVDRDPVCGYTGVIGDVCPRCGRREGEAIDPERFEELRRIYPNMPCLIK